jgi:hypothetical protein
VSNPAWSFPRASRQAETILQSSCGPQTSLIEVYSNPQVVMLLHPFVLHHHLVRWVAYSATDDLKAYFILKQRHAHSGA